MDTEDLLQAMLEDQEGHAAEVLRDLQADAKEMRTMLLEGTNEATG